MIDSPHSLAGVVEALRWRRKELGMSQRALADKVGCHENTICGIENKRIGLTLEMFKSVCDALSWEDWRVLRTVRRGHRKPDYAHAA